MENLIDYFMTGDSVFAILFVALFVYHVKTAREREVETRDRIKDEIKLVRNDVSLLVTLWKALIEDEIKSRK